MKNIVLILHNIRSTYNVGAITRTAECLGVNKIYATGYTAYTESDILLAPPFIIKKMRDAIHKTALGAENIIPVVHRSDIDILITDLRREGYKIIALEQHKNSIKLDKYNDKSPVAVIVGEEVKGITENLIHQADEILEIPMYGKKESFNVSVAVGIMLYEMQRQL